MPPADVPGEPDYFSRYLKEGVKSPEDATFDPELQRILDKLYDRQRGEAQDLHIERLSDIKSYGTPDHPYMKKDHRADNAAQEKRFTEERQRYIREYDDAKVIREELKQREQERQRTLDKGRTL
jgi:hypothetical protein